MAGGGKTGAWSSRTNDKSQWIKVDFGEVNRVTQVASQGRSDYAQWVTRYKVSYSAFGKEFKSQDHVSYRVMFAQSSASFKCDFFLILILPMTTMMMITENIAGSSSSVIIISMIITNFAKKHIRCQHREQSLHIYLYASFCPPTLLNNVFSFHLNVSPRTSMSCFSGGKITTAAGAAR